MSSFPELPFKEWFWGIDTKNPIFEAGSWFEGFNPAGVEDFCYLVLTIVPCRKTSVSQANKSPSCVVMLSSHQARVKLTGCDVIDLRDYNDVVDL